MFGNNNGFGNDAGFGGFDTGMGFGQQTQGFDLGQGAMDGGFAQMSDLNFGDAPMAPTGTGLQTVSIRKVFLTMTRRHNDQWRRNYEVTATGQTMNSIADAVAQQGGRGLSNESLSSLMADQAVTGPALFSYMGTPEANVGIENGWNEQRFRFVIVADVYMNGKYRKTEFISGYTDEPAIVNAQMENSRAIDPNMQFVINNVTYAGVRRGHTPQGYTDFTQISSTNAVVRNENWSLSGNGGLWVMRPEDVLGTVDKLTLIDGIAQAAEFGEVPTFGDLDTTLTGMPKMSARAADMITTYTSRMVNGMIESRLGEADIMNEDAVGTGTLAASKMRENLFSRGAFVFALGQKTASNTVSTATFTYGDLMRMDPTVDSRVSVFTKAYDTTPGLQVPDGSSVANIADASQHCVAATMIANSIMSLMSQAGITLMVYDAGNENLGQYSIVPAFDGMDSDGMLANRVETLKNRMETEVLNILSLAGNLSYKVHVVADVFNDVFVQLRLDGEEGDYVVPAFASSHMAPVVTNDQSRLTDFARSMQDVVDNCLNVSTHDSGSQFAMPNAGGAFGAGSY